MRKITFYFSRFSHFHKHIVILVHEDLEFIQRPRRRAGDDGAIDIEVAVVARAKEMAFFRHPISRTTKMRTRRRQRDEAAAGIDQHDFAAAQILEGRAGAGRQFICGSHQYPAWLRLSEARAEKTESVKCRGTVTQEQAGAHPQACEK